MIAAPSGPVGPFLARHRTAVLSAVAAAAGIATAVALSWLQAIAVAEVVAVAVAAVLAAVVVYWQTRHPALALLAALAPLPGLVWAAPLSGGAHFGAVPFLGYGFGAAVAALACEDALDRTLQAGEGAPPWRAAVAALGLGAVLAVLWFRQTPAADAVLQAIADAAAATLSVFLLLPLTLPLVRFGEAAIAAANRVRERRARRFEWLGGGAMPRWGLSLLGIALILLALGWFESDAVFNWRVGVTGVLALAGLGAVAGGWREGVGLALIAAIAALMVLWWRHYDGRLPFASVCALAIAMLAAMLGLAAAGRMKAWRRAGDEPEKTRRHILEQSGGAVFAVLVATAATGPALAQVGVVVVLAVPVAGLAGGLLFAAALGGIETLLPRRKTLDDVFGKMRRR